MTVNLHGVKPHLPTYISSINAPNSIKLPILHSKNSYFVRLATFE